MRIVNLSSGSDGNLTYIETESAKILVDAGLSCKEIEKRLSLLKINGNEIDAIFITHEHSDHVKGLDIFARKYETNVYAHNDGWTALSTKLSRIKEEQKKCFDCNSFIFKDLNITAFKLPHDSVCCVGFTIENKNKRVSLLTDLGNIDNQILQNVFGSQLVYLEANHDIELLKNNICYPASLKRRILSKVGHLSNIVSAEAINLLAQNGTRQVVLSHLSKDNNDPVLAYMTIKQHLLTNGIIEGENIKIDVATTKPGKIYRIS
ncbi:MAG: MBL fold metallo-hydrolase [Clostridia bacterium]|nr:MBL fold metallo-hydrolase [Clostridia bacterium]